VPSLHRFAAVRADSGLNREPADDWLLRNLDLNLLDRFSALQMWMMLTVAMRHPLWETICLPIWSWLYVCQCDIALLASRYYWEFRTKVGTGGRSGRTGRHMLC
jgi:hypothetical protein